MPRLDGVRVLVVFGGTEMLGQERANLEVFRNLAELGLKARFITSSKWGHQQIQPELDQLRFGWTTAPFGYHWGKSILGRDFLNLFINLFGVLATSWCVWREAKRWKATHLYAGNWGHLTFAGPALLLLHLPFVYRIGEELPTNTRFHRFYSRWLLRRAARLVCNSKFLECQIGVLSPSCSWKQVICNHPPVRTRPKKDLTLLIPPGATVIVYVGQIIEGKGVHLLVQAVRRLLQRGRNVSLLVAGDSVWDVPLGSRLRQEVQREKLEGRIQFLGYVDDVPGLLQYADLHACPSVWVEGSPNVVLEAKREGVPSVVFPVGGLPELVEHKVDGYVCEEPSVAALVAGLEYFVMDAVRCQQAGDMAKQSLEGKYGVARFRCQWAEVFSQTLAVPEQMEVGQRRYSAS